MSSFNEQIDVSTLPRVQDLNYQPLQPVYLKVMLWVTTLRLVVASAGLFAGFIFLGPDIPDILSNTALGLWILIIAWSYIVTFYGFRYKSYALRKEDISYRSGWISRTITTASFNRVQHVQIDRGVIDRYFGLARLKVYTAGGSSSDITIPGLLPAEAQSMKAFIVKRTKSDEEE